MINSKAIKLESFTDKSPSLTKGVGPSYVLDKGPHPIWEKENSFDRSK